MTSPLTPGNVVSVTNTILQGKQPFSVTRQAVAQDASAILCCLQGLSDS